MRHFLTTTTAIVGLCALSACGGGSEQATEETAPAPVTSSVGPVQFSSAPADGHAIFADFVFSASGASRYECALDSQTFQTCTSPLNLLPLSQGSHRFQAQGFASDGTTGTATTHTWNVHSVLNPVHEDLIETTVQPAPAGADGWRGIFRINCDFAHASYNDPIVYPNQENAAHMHMFYGNVLVDHATDMKSLYTSGDSSCQGNALNRSSYWVPALLAPLYDAAGQRQLDTDGNPAWQVVQAVVGNDEEAHEVFYYSAAVDDLASIQSVPAGLRMIAGSATAIPGSEQSTSIVRWHCQSWESNDANNPRFSASIPECVAPDRLRFDIFFPSCWDGVNLDSADHKSHMAYPTNDGGPNGTRCPASHPVPVARVSYHYAFGVRPENYDPVTRSSKGWRLASDMYTVQAGMPGGVSLHGDWFNGWNPEVMDMLVANCVRGALDCHDGNLANGKRLSGTRPGTKTIPAIINDGLGHSHHH